MKKILTLIAVLMTLTVPAMAQRGGAAPNWITIAAKVGAGNSILFCQQISDDENIKQNYLSPSFSIGGRLGVVFVDRIGVSVEYLSSNYQNKYEYTPELVQNKISSNLKIKTSDLLILARYTGEYGFYAEIGPKITSVKDIQFAAGDMPNHDLTDCFKKSFNSIVFGFGFSPYNGERVIVSLGIRAAYCSSSIVKDIPNFQGGLGNKPFINLEMKPFSAQATLDIGYHFARFGSATCGKQKIIFFK